MLMTNLTRRMLESYIDKYSGQRQTERRTDRHETKRIKCHITTEGITLVYATL